MFNLLTRLFKNIVLKKGLITVAKSMVAFLIAMNLDRFGVAIEVDLLEASIVSLMIGALDSLRNWVKHKFGWNLL